MSYQTSQVRSIYHLSRTNVVLPSSDCQQAPSSTRHSYITSIHSIIALILWTFLSLNALLDPIKTFYGYYIYTDSENQPAVWDMTVENNYNNKTSNVCNDNFLDCYYELPVYGTGVLASSVCRSYYPIDKGATQHFGTFFANCTLSNGNHIYLPNSEFATTQWSLLLSSQEKSCISTLGEGDSFPCDSYTTVEGRVLYFRPSRTTAPTWCKEFGGYYILNKDNNQLDVLVANISNPLKLSFTSIPLIHNTTVYNLFGILGCSADLTIGGAGGHISSSAWYGTTIGLWMAHTSNSPAGNTINIIDDMVNVATMTSVDGNITQIHTFYKDAIRCSLLLIVIYYRLSSIYYPMWLVYNNQEKPFWSWVFKRHMGLVLHKRERRNMTILFFLTVEAIMSTEDIVMYCQQSVFTYPTLLALALKYMSITRIIWPSSFILLIVSRFIQIILGSRYAFALSEDLFLLGAPVIWFYMPAYVTSKGVRLFQGWRWTGTIIHHYGNTILKVYENQVSVLTLYYDLFGAFTLMSCLTTICIGCLWQSLTRTSSIMSVILSNSIYYRCIKDVQEKHCNIEKVLRECNKKFPPEIVYQITKAKLPATHLCEAMNLASEGFICLVYGEYELLGTTEWGFNSPIFNEKGHAAVINGCQVAYQSTVTRVTLAHITSRPQVLGVPDLQ
ncbi:hypothetical protein THRCLA_22076 [Thraustotheca clavata]|uniref:Uncharacterized protein n=1 Tax=Thraustotheca clavata TaxID=74557 RepID=A0A1V9ZCR9_9STRA|nr:hypothetical protein THRCLA_22076 [Thraustotheca clavata]